MTDLYPLRNLPYSTVRYGLLDDWQGISLVDDHIHIGKRSRVKTVPVASPEGEQLLHRVARRRAELLAQSEPGETLTVLADGRWANVPAAFARDELAKMDPALAALAGATNQEE